MPFIEKGSASATITTTSLRVDPEKVLQLKAELQPIHDKVENFLNTKGRSMLMQPLGADPVSRDTAEAFNENAQAAITASRGYLGEIKGVLDALDQAVKTYNLVEDTTTQTFQRGAQ